MLGRLTRSLTSPQAVESLRQDMGADSPHTAKARLEDLCFASLAWPCHQRDDSSAKALGPVEVLSHRSTDGTPRAATQCGPARRSRRLSDRNIEREQPGTYAHFSDVMHQKTSGNEVDFCGPRFGKLGLEGKYLDSGGRQEALTVRSAFGAGFWPPEACWRPPAMCGRAGALDRLDAQRLTRCQRLVRAAGAAAASAEAKSPDRCRGIVRNRICASCR